MRLLLWAMGVLPRSEKFTKHLPELCVWKMRGWALAHQLPPPSSEMAPGSSNYPSSLPGYFSETLGKFLRENKDLYLPSTLGTASRSLRLPDKALHSCTWNQSRPGKASAAWVRPPEPESPAHPSVPPTNSLVGLPTSGRLNTGPPKDIHILIPGTYKCYLLCQK